MTGNVVFLAFAIVGVHGLSVSASLLALATFIFGAVVGGHLGRRSRARRQWLVIATGGEALLLAGGGPPAAALPVACRVSAHFQRPRSGKSTRLVGSGSQGAANGRRGRPVMIAARWSAVDRSPPWSGIATDGDGSHRTRRGCDHRDDGVGEVRDVQERGEGGREGGRGEGGGGKKGGERGGREGDGGTEERRGKGGGGEGRTGQAAVLHAAKVSNAPASSDSTTTVPSWPIPRETPDRAISFTTNAEMTTRQATLRHPAHLWRVGVTQEELGTSKAQRGPGARCNRASSVASVAPRDSANATYHASYDVTFSRNSQTGSRRVRRGTASHAGRGGLRAQSMRYPRRDPRPSRRAGECWSPRPASDAAR